MPARGAAGPPTLLALDEVANIAPIPDLPAMVSEGAGQGLLVLACLQDLSQARGRWGGAADGFLSLFGTTVVLRGIGDTTTLRDISALAGDRVVAATTINRSIGRWGRIRPSTSVGSSREPRLPVDAVAHGSPGRALVLGPHKEVEEVTLTPSHEHSPWRELRTAQRTRSAHADGAPPRALSQRTSPRSTPTGSRAPEPCPHGIEVPSRANEVCEAGRRQRRQLRGTRSSRAAQPSR